MTAQQRKDADEFLHRVRQRIAPESEGEVAGRIGEILLLVLDELDMLREHTCDPHIRWRR